MSSRPHLAPSEDDLDDGGFTQLPPFDHGSREPNIIVLRHTVTADALLTAEQVVHLLGGRQSVVRRWLRQVPSMWHPTGRRLYRWGDVLASLRQQMREVA